MGTYTPLDSQPCRLLQCNRDITTTEPGQGSVEPRSTPSGVYTLMISRIGFRRVLPILFTLVHVVLLLYVAAQRQDALSNFQGEFAYHPAAYQENSIAWEPMEPKPLMLAEKLGIVLNLPAFVLAIPFALLFFHGNDVGLWYTSLPVVPLIWYGVGRWLDRLRGHISHSPPARRNWHGLFASLSAIVLFISIVSVPPISRHRTGDTYWIGFCLILWSGRSLAISISGAIRPARN